MSLLSSKLTPLNLILEVADSDSTNIVIWCSFYTIDNSTEVYSGLPNISNDIVVVVVVVVVVVHNNTHRSAIYGVSTLVAVIAQGECDYRLTSPRLILKICARVCCCKLIVCLC